MQATSELSMPMPGCDSTESEGSAPASHLSSSTTKILPDTDIPLTVEAMMEDLAISFFVGAGDEVTGNIKVQQGKSIVVRGRVNGSIECRGFVVILKEGHVEGSIKAGQLWIEGEVGSASQGNSKIDVGTLHINKGARVYADCVYDQISIATPNRGLRGNLEARSATTKG